MVFFSVTAQLTTRLSIYAAPAPFPLWGGWLVWSHTISLRSNRRSCQADNPSVYAELPFKIPNSKILIHKIPGGTFKTLLWYSQLWRHLQVIKQPPPSTRPAEYICIKPVGRTKQKPFFFRVSSAREDSKGLICMYGPPSSDLWWHNCRPRRHKLLWRFIDSASPRRCCVSRRQKWATAFTFTPTHTHTHNSLSLHVWKSHSWLFCGPMKTKVNKTWPALWIFDRFKCTYHVTPRYSPSAGTFYETLPLMELWASFNKHNKLQDSISWSHFVFFSSASYSEVKIQQASREVCGKGKKREERRCTASVIKMSCNLQLMD